MPEELDYNKIAAEFVNQNIETFFNLGKGILKGAAHSVRLRLTKSYQSYLTCVIDRYSNAKSFFIRHEARPLAEFYVPLGVSCGTQAVISATIGSISALNRFSIITGAAGIGKSMMMRHLFLDTIVSTKKVPVFLELRELNQNRLNLREFIAETLAMNRFALDNEYVERALKAGHFVLFFDGFDEVSLSLRKSIGSQLRQLSAKYDQNLIIISSRPDNEFSGWQTFSVMEINPLTLKQACELVEKLPYDPELKRKFVKDLRLSLFSKHQSFLSNPLLLSIMLITYGMSADIPTKISVFYNQAYEALFQRHDALKGGYQRDRLCNLDIQDFGRVFACFALQTYDKRAFQFSKTEALHYLEKCKDLLSFDFNSGSFLTDALQAVCLLVEDGLFLSFSHRSFQEYFTASFIADATPQVQKRLIEKFQKGISNDSVLALLYEMKPELVEAMLIIPNLEALQNFIGMRKKLGMRHYVRYIRAEYSILMLHRNEVEGWIYAKNARSYHDIVSFALYHCGQLVEWPGYERGSINVSTVREAPTTQLDIASLPAASAVFRELASGNHLLSFKALEYALKAKTALIEKHRRLDQSIDEILR